MTSSSCSFIPLNFRKLKLLKSVLCPEEVITDTIQRYPELANILRISKMYQNLFIGCSFIKIIAVEFGAI